MAKTIILLRRDPESLTFLEQKAFEKSFPGEELNFVRTDPVNYSEHARDCERLRPAAVLLPMERPIPSQAMEEGFQHVILGKEGLSELLPLNPKFRPFVPH